jgi:hypothetical protein
MKKTLLILALLLSAESAAFSENGVLWNKTDNGNELNTFSEILKKYNLIGMPQAQLMEIFGEPLSTFEQNKESKEWPYSKKFLLPQKSLIPQTISKLIDYSLVDSDVSTFHHGLELGLDDNNRVVGWHIISDQEDGRWFTQDVVMITPSNADMTGNLEPKVPPFDRYRRHPTKANVP